MLNILKFIKNSSFLLIIANSMLQAMQPVKTMKQNIVLNSDFSMDIAYNIENENMENTILFIHGNSASKEFFLHLNSDLLPNFRLIKVDLPGHGESDDFSMLIQEQYEKDNNTIFKNYNNFYTFAGYAQVMNKFIDNLSIDRNKLNIVGWSLGGHVAIDMTKDYHVNKIILTGTPIQSFKDMNNAFTFLKNIPLNNDNFESNISIFDLLGFNNKFTESQAIVFHAAGGFITQDGEIAKKAGTRTNPIARSAMIHFCANAFSKEELAHMNQNDLVLSKKDIFKIIQGSKDPIKSTNNDLEIIEIEDAGHAVFHSHPQEYTQSLLSVLNTN